MDNKRFNIAEEVMRTVEMVDTDKRINRLHCVSSRFPDETPVAMAYIPFQLDRTAYTPEKAFENGTLFTVLNKPFKGRSVRSE